MHKNAKIYVAGHRGMVGSAILRRLRSRGYGNLLVRGREELDLLDQNAVRAFMLAQRPDYIFLAAAKVGGIHANNVYRADFIHQNLAIQTNLIQAAHEADVSHLLFLGSSCIYPRDCAQPIREEYLLTGSLEPTNEPYAIAKIAGVKMCESYQFQYGRAYASVMPTNLYGIGDNYDLQASHVLPALIRKVHLARLAMQGDVAGIRRNERRYGPIPDEVLSGLGCERDSSQLVVSSGATRPQASIILWGSGTPRREFLFVDDLAECCVHLMETGYAGPLLNVGTGVDVSIRELAMTVMRVIGVESALRFDSTKPDGTPRKLLDVSRLTAAGWRAHTDLEQGIAMAYQDFVEQEERCDEAQPRRG